MIRRGRNGQQLIICALFISILVISTQAYIYRLDRSSPSIGYSYLSDYPLGFRQGSRHAVVASLVNVSNGGPSSNMGGFLDKWETFAAQDYSFGRCSLNATIASLAPYSNGVRLDFVITTQSGGSDSVTVEWWVGAQQGSGTYTIDSTNDALDIRVSFDDVLQPNDGSWSWADVGNIEIRLVGVKAAGFDTITYAVDEAWGWVTVAGGEWEDASLAEDYSETDYGNGTYTYSFIVTMGGTEVEVRMQTYDRRGIFVQVEDIFY